LRFGPSPGSSPEGLAVGRPWTARPLGSGPITGPSSLLRAGPSLCPASVLCRSRFSPLAGLPLATRGPTTPISTGRRYRGDRFSCSMPAPATSSRHLYTGHRQGHEQAAPWLRAHPVGRAFVPGHPSGPGFDAIAVFHDASAVVHTRSSSRRSPDPLIAGLLRSRFPPRLLTDMTLRWFGISACTANPEGQPPSLAQHGWCWRSSTSSSLSFQDTRKARNPRLPADRAAKRAGRFDHRSCGSRKVVLSCSVRSFPTSDQAIRSGQPHVADWRAIFCPPEGVRAGQRRSRPRAGSRPTDRQSP
jgi:hypothetical protein